MKTVEERLTTIETRLNSRALPDKAPGDCPTGRVMRQRRKAYGLAMHQVKSRGGPSIAFQSAIENGKQTVVSVPVLIRWCAAIGCEPIMVFADIVSEMKAPLPPVS